MSAHVYSLPMIGPRDLFRRLRSLYRRHQYKLLERDEQRFLKLYLSFEHPNALPLNDSDPLVSPIAQTVPEAVCSLHRNGVVKWPSFLCDKSLHELLCFFDGLFDDYRRLDAENCIVDNAYFCSSTKATFLPRSLSKSSSNRRRIQFLLDTDIRKRELLDPLASLISSENLTNLLRSYFGLASDPGYLLLEEMTAGPALEWHFDRISDQLKVMFLLSDVGEQDGPLRVRMSSHLFSDMTKPYYHDVFTSGVSYAYPGPGVVASLDLQDFLATGLAGDAIFFNTRTIHSGTELRSDSPRKVIVATYYPSTRRNKWLSSLCAHWV